MDFSELYDQIALKLDVWSQKVVPQIDVHFVLNSLRRLLVVTEQPNTTGTSLTH